MAVYGTVRTGQPNHRLVAGEVVGRDAAWIPEHALYLDCGLPYAVPEPGRRVAAELLWLHPERYDQLLATLDDLEGYAPHRRDNHYERIRCLVTRPGRAEPVRAWVYRGGRAARERLHRRGATPLTSGDWLTVC